MRRSESGEKFKNRKVWQVAEKRYEEARMPGATSEEVRQYKTVRRAFERITKDADGLRNSFAATCSAGEGELHLDPRQFDDIPALQGVGLRADGLAVDHGVIFAAAVALDVRQEIALRPA